MDCVVHVAFIMHVTWYNRQWHLALDMHRDIALNGCECMVGKSTLRLAFDWVSSVKWDNVQQSRTVD